MQFMQMVYFLEVIIFLILLQQELDRRTLI